MPALEVEEWGVRGGVLPAPPLLGPVGGLGQSWYQPEGPQRKTWPPSCSRGACRQAEGTNGNKVLKCPVDRDWRPSLGGRLRDSHQLGGAAQDDSRSTWPWSWALKRVELGYLQRAGGVLGGYEVSQVKNPFPHSIGCCCLPGTGRGRHIWELQ